MDMLPVYLTGPIKAEINGLFQTKIPVDYSDAHSLDTSLQAIPFTQAHKSQSEGNYTKHNGRKAMLNATIWPVCTIKQFNNHHIKVDK